MQSQALDVDSYIAEVPADRAPTLVRLRKLYLEILVGFKEGMRYGLPSYSRGGVVEAAFASQKNYIALYFLNGVALEGRRERLTDASVGKGCIRYTKPEKIDFALVREILEATVETPPELRGC